MTDSHPSLGPRCPGRPAIASCTSASAALGKADFELRLYRHRDRRCDSPRRRVALLFQCSFPLGIPSSPSVMLSKNSQRSRSNLSTPLRKLRGTSASCSCRRKETLKKLHYWATDSTLGVVTAFQYFQSSMHGIQRFNAQTQDHFTLLKHARTVSMLELCFEGG